MSNKIEQSQQKPKRTWASIGCVCLFWSTMAFFGFSCAMTFIVPLLFPNLWVSDGEHLPTAEFAPQSTNYSFSTTYMRRYEEFDIPETAFLEMCKKWDRTPILIETLPDLPQVNRDFDRDRHKPRINTARKCPLQIDRYCRSQPKHKDCQGYPLTCKIDSTGLTDESCFRVVSKGYYFEHRISNGGGMYVLYDLSNGRFYSEWNRR